MRACNESILLPHLGDELGLYREVTPATGSRLHQDDGLPVTQRCNPLIGSTKGRIELPDELLTFCFLGDDSLSEGLALPSHPLLLVSEFAFSLLQALSLLLRRLAMLFGEFHELQDLILKAANMLLPGFDLGKDGAVLFIGLDLSQLVLGFGQLRLKAVEFTLASSPLTLGLFDAVVEMGEFPPRLGAGEFVRLELSGQIVPFNLQSMQPVVKIL
jgi:hypothetical protein